MSTTRFSLCLALLMAIPAVAQSQGQPRGSEGGKAEASAPAEGQQPGTARSGKFSLEQAEALANESLAAKMRAISEKRRENIAKLEQLLANPDYRKDPERAPKVMHMLAEAWWEERLYQYLQQRAEWEKAMEAYNQGRLTEPPAEPVEDYTESLNLYRRILQEFPGYARIDEVYYYLGKGALKEGKAKKNRALQKEGVEYLNRLVKDYPKSKWIAEALLAMAEYYFETNSLFYAKTNYERIIQQFPNSSMVNYAMYKLAWVYFNLREYDTAIEMFQKVVAAVGKQGTGKGVIEFRNQALNDLVVTFAEVDNGWQRARDYFLKVMPEEEAYKKLRMLGDLYVGQDKIPEAVALFRHFIERERTTPTIVEYYKILLSVYKNTNDYDNLDRVTMEALEYFKPNGSWRTANRNREETLQEADALTEEYLLYIANYYHREAQRLNRADLYRKAADKYQVYLSRFHDSKNAYVVNFYYAEILYDQMKDYQQALEQYKKVIERDTKGEYVEDAALGVIYATQELMVAAGITEGTKKGEGIEVVRVDPKKAEAPIPETDLHPLEVDYVSAADTYVRLLTDLIRDPEVRKKNPKRGEKIPEIMFIAAQVFYRHGKFQDAVERLQVLFEYDPSSKFAAYAVFTLLDCYQRLQQWTKVEEWARRLIAARNFTVKSEKELKKIVAIAMTENARLLSVEKKYGQASDEAMRVYEEFRGNEELASKALFNVAALYESQKEPDKAIRIYLRVVREFPKSDVAPEALFTVAMIYESQTEFEKAAETFEAMEQFRTIPAPQAGDSEEKKESYRHLQTQMADAFQNAGLIREALGEYRDAIEVYQKFLKQFPEHPDAPMVHLRIGRAYEAMKTAEGLRKAHETYAAWLKKGYKRGDLAVEAAARAGDCLKRLDKVKQRKAAVAFFQQALEIFGRLQEAEAVRYSKQYAAQAAFELADYLYDDFSELRIPSTVDPGVLKKALAAKAEAQQRAEKAFDAVLSYKSGGWSAGALFKMGLLYYEFYKELDNVPIPDCPCPGVPQKDCRIVQAAFRNGDLDTIQKYDWGMEWLSVAPTFQDQYRSILEEIMRPVQEKSLRAFERALTLAHEEKVYNQWSRACAEYAVRVNPDTFPVVGDELTRNNRSKDTLATTSFIRTLRRQGVEVRMVEEVAP